jgi:hypothetical protein
MGTRGVYGFRIDGVDKLAYNHYDSYPDGLGASIVTEVRGLSHTMLLEDLRESVRGIEMVDEASKPTEKQKQLCRDAGLVDLHVSEKSEDDWYCLMRGGQGSLIFPLRLGFMLDSGDFIKDSLFCEWGYIVNLDTGMLEVWEGYQTRPQVGNRYGEDENGEGYFPCKMAGMFALGTVTAGDMETLERAPADAEG